METIIEKILSGRIAEFSYQGEKYLIQEENNKGWNYLSLWQITPRSTCLCRAFFDIIDGVSEDTIQELLSLPCVEGLTVMEMLSHAELETGDAKR